MRTQDQVPQRTVDDPDVAVGQHVPQESPVLAHRLPDLLPIQRVLTDEKRLGDPDERLPPTEAVALDPLIGRADDEGLDRVVRGTGVDMSFRIVDNA